MNGVIVPQDTMETYHYPVMHREAIELLDIKNKNVIVDCTVGVGSCALKFLEVMKSDAHLLGIDKDEESLRIAEKILKPFEGKFTLRRDDFSNLDAILHTIKLKADVFFFDLGISSFQLNNPQGGFSFLKEGPLDMRMDRNAFLSAYDLINNLSEIELGAIFRRFGEERFAKRIAHFIAEKRKKEPIYTTTQLARIVLDAVGLKGSGGRIHPATRIFQALRIAVNRELEILKIGITKAITLVTKGGRIGVISFHSLEDRIVKHTFREYASNNTVRLITKKPLTPQAQELAENISSRSAKFRVVEKI